MKRAVLRRCQNLASLWTAGLVLCPGPARAGEPDGGTSRPAELEIVYHGDLDGRFARPDCQTGRLGEPPTYARLVGVLGQVRADAAAAGSVAPVVLLGGNLAAPDLFGRSLLGHDEDGARKVSKLLARAAYDAVALGHHDLALEPARLFALVDALAAGNLPVVATNLGCEGARASLCERARRHALVRRGGETIGILASISPSVMSGLGSESRSGLRLEDPLTSVRSAARSLRDRGATRVLLLAQGPRDGRGLPELMALQRGLGALEPGEGGARGPAVDVIFAGGLADDDGNRALELLRRQGAPPAVGSPSGPAALARVRLTHDSRAGASGDVQAELLLVPAAAAEAERAVEPDPAVEALLTPELAAYCRENEQQLSPPPTRGALSVDELLTYALEVLRRRAGAEVALVNRALFKPAAFPIEGPITRGQLHAALPYRTVMGVARVTGATLASVLGPALGNPKAATVGLARRGSDLTVNGRPLNKARAYRVATISFVAAGGDDLIDADALPWRPLPDAPDLRDAIAEFLRSETGRHDGDPSVDPRTDFGAPPSERLLLVGLADGGLDVADTRIDNGPGYGDPQLARGRQRVWKAEWTGILQTRHPRHESDSRLNLVYGWTRSQPAGQPAASTETADLITFTSVYNYRGLRKEPAVPRRHVPDPYVRAGIEAELTRPPRSETQTRGYHHLELTGTAGVLFTLTPALKVRAGAGARKELLTSSAPAGHFRPVLEAGGTLSPLALATIGPLPVRAEGLVDYVHVDPAGGREHQLRASGKLSVPLLPLLFVTVGLDVFAVQRGEQGWAASYDTTLGLRVHLDTARQWL